MNLHVPHINLALAWLWVVMGFATGAALGMNFHHETWLGGYGSFRRRLYRLGHISFFGLAIINVMFYCTATRLGLGGATTVLAAWGFIVGAVSMPACCVVMAHNPKLPPLPLFFVPVGSLLTGGILTLWEVVKL